MKTTHHVSAGFAQAIWDVYEMSRHGALAIQRGDRADAGTRTTPAVHMINPQATHTAACLSSSEDRSDCGLARVAPESRARANRYSQEERVTSHQRPYANRYAMSTAIGAL